MGDKFDTEILAMRKLTKTLEELDPAARARVLAYAVARFVDEAHAVPLRRKALEDTAGNGAPARVTPS